MENIKLGMVESHFADLIWQNEPINSRALAQLCEKELGWKRTTTYTILKKLCDKGLFKNENAMVSSLISKEEYNFMQSENFVKEVFDGSLPAFIATFTNRKALSAEELEEIRKTIDSIGKK